MRAAVESSARPCVRLARLATWLTRKASARLSSAGSAAGSSCAALTSGNALQPACQSASRRNRRSPSAEVTSRACTAASSPAECAKPPVGNAESANCKILQRASIVRSRSGLEQRVELRKRQALGRVASQQHAVGANLVRLGIDGQLRQRVVELHVALAQGPAAAHRAGALGKTERIERTLCERAPRHEDEGGRAHRED